MRISLLASIAVLMGANAASADTLSGKYVEARNAAMWAGPCLYNSEMGTVGNKATLAWKVDQGSFDDVTLDGLSIVAIVFGNQTFGMGRDVKTQTIFVIDENASEEQRSALMGMAKSLAKETIQEVINVRHAKVDVEVSADGSGYSRVDAGIARIRTRRLRRSDNLCGTDARRMVYPALAQIKNEQAAYTLENRFSASQAGIAIKRFEDRNEPSAVIGSFSL